ncbi:MAG TPA: CvpA family protein [Candidatus Saccharimonadales bacterium]|nr:CvpA family protein [Candidatus Saccharimonadales bacterium]
MITFDIILAIILAIFIFSGLRKGLIRSLGRIIGLIAGAFVASHFYLTFFEWGRSWAGGHEAVGKVLAFIILFIVVTSLINLVFFLIEKVFNLIAIIPGSRYLNNILGALLGLLEGSLFLGLIVFVASRYALLSNLFGDNLSRSIIAPWLLKVVNIVLPVLPEALKALKSII